ncbi:MAG: AAA family ATPase [Candidatus Spyradenecus sp.]
MEDNINVQISEFPQIRESGSIYVDKTGYFSRLVKPRPSGSRVFFLARPRRFGKSLMISTLKAIFQGKRELFEGLAISKTDYDWQPYPVLHFDLSMATGETFESFMGGFRTAVRAALLCAGIKVEEDAPRERFAAALLQLQEQGKQAVVLIDEYDAPICHALNKPDLCERIRGELANFYSVLKANQAVIRFAMITGISKFASMAVFSGLNNIVDLTYDPAYATMLGYTQEELEANFAEHLDRRAREMQLSKADFMAGLAKWFNGYRFARQAPASVYNPVAIARTLTSSEEFFQAQWSTTGRPSTLTTFLRRNELLEMDFEQPLMASPAELEAPSQLAALSPIVVLYQTGYLTIKGYDATYDSYILGVPDEEIRRDLNAFLCELAIPDDAQRSRLNAHLRYAHRDAFLRADLPDFYAKCHYGATEERIQEYNYQRLLQAFFLARGFEPIAEAGQSSGKRADLVVKLPDFIYLFEFKTDGTTAQEALQQIKDKGYATPYLHDGRPLVIVGLSFHKGKRELQSIAYEDLPSQA